MTSLFTPTLNQQRFFDKDKEPPNIGKHLAERGEGISLENTPIHARGITWHKEDPHMVILGAS